MIGRAALLAVASFGLMAQARQERFPSSFTIDAPQGQFDGWEEDDAQSYVAVRARITTLRLGPYGDWSPGVTLNVDDNQRSVALKAYSDAEGLPLEVYAQLVVDQEDAGVTPFDIVLDPAQPFDVELRWTSDGHVCMTVKQSGRSESLMYPLGAPPANIGLYGSSGSYRFDAVEQITLSAGQNRADVDAALKVGCTPIS